MFTYILIAIELGITSVKELTDEVDTDVTNQVASVAGNCCRSNKNGLKSRPTAFLFLDCWFGKIVGLLCSRCNGLNAESKPFLF